MPPHRTRMPLSRIRHFERKREIFLVRGKVKAVRGAGNGKHPAPGKSGSRCFMQTVPRRKRNTANEKDPSAALGMTIREYRSPARLSSLCDANLRPFGAPPSKGRRENAAGIGLPFLAHRLRGVPLRGKEKECRSSHRHFERKREIFSVPFSHDPCAKPLRGSTASAFPRYGVSRFLLSNTLRLTANEKDPSAALGMTKRGKAYLTFLFKL